MSYQVKIPKLKDVFRDVVRYINTNDYDGIKLSIEYENGIILSLSNFFKKESLFDIVYSITFKHSNKLYKHLINNIKDVKYILSLFDIDGNKYISINRYFKNIKLENFNQDKPYEEFLEFLNGLNLFDFDLSSNVYRDVMSDVFRNLNIEYKTKLFEDYPMLEVLLLKYYPDTKITKSKIYGKDYAYIRLKLANKRHPPKTCLKQFKINRNHYYEIYPVKYS